MLRTVSLLCSINLVNGLGIHNTTEFDLKSKIIGGHEIDITSRPFMVSLHNYFQGLQCGASILSRRWAITALHCFSLQPNEYYVRAGSNYTNKGGTLHKIKNVYAYNLSTYPYWLSNVHYHDVALFEVTPRFRFSKTIQPGRIPTEDFAPPILYVSGWGYIALNGSPHHTLMAVMVPHVPFETCVRAVPLYSQIVKRDQHLCYGSSGKDSCYGDSGGPLANRRTIYGIVSFGYNCAEVSGIYAKVSYYREWIKHLTNIQ